ncbi:hypothetical protein M422DRAFT_784422 [Sphaerobolus stellatus SS14]|uniref:Cytochrome P450 n=1 Tax=Sphaerobolus stellatus (strain SS14) TaxID=990650 RepID=A0A0C9TBF7_SPHS4|nr:hypothetical protein M422DRAFT_785261 [Sphaerobolus stellatus SS14]KIJ29077.1 hypothetical protein M422DRAFT_784422 [Sphaerobolus stellatus SS14]
MSVLYIAAAILLYQFYRLIRRSAQRPPGPKPWPIIGNLLQMPKSHEWLTFAACGIEYGHCVYLTILGQPILVLSSLQAANELLEQRSAIYSSRPRLVMAGDLTGFDQSIALMPYTDRFREMRQLLKKELSDSSLKIYWPLHEEESRILVKNLLAEPAQLADWVRYYAGSIILKVTYVMAAFSEASQPGNWLVDLIPWLRHVPDWMPGAEFKRKATQWSKLHMEVIEEPYIWAKAYQDSMALITPHFTTTVLSTESNEALTEEQDNLLLWASASLFGGGADTTVAAISSFFLAMALHPEIQRQGQKEIDDVLHGKRLPKVEDMPSLPFVRNIMREVLRWNPVAPLGVPHLLTQDEMYRNYKTPKGTIVMPNIWLILHDPEVFPEPNNFNPIRFFKSERAVKTLGVAFGFGRRPYPGVSFAESSMFIAIATALAVCDISTAVDNERGSSISANVLYKTGTISHPPAFTCSIKSRSESAMKLLQRTLEEEKVS